MKKYGSLIMIVAIFFVVTKVFQPTDPAATGVMILKALGVAAATVVGIVLIFLYVKSGLYPKWENFSVTPSTMAVLETTALFALLLLTASYSFGGSWMRWSSVLWMWRSGMFLPSLLAIGGIVVFANGKWRKRINDGLIFLIGAFIATTFAVNAFMGWWTGEEKVPQPDIAEAVTKPAPQPTIVATPEPPKPRIEKAERKVVGEYGVFTKAELPPMEKLVELELIYETPRDKNECLVAIIYDAAPEGKVWRCREIPPRRLKGIVQKNVTRVGISSSRIGRDIPVTVKMTYVPVS